MLLILRNHSRSPAEICLFVSQPNEFTGKRASGSRTARLIDSHRLDAGTEEGKGWHGGSYSLRIREMAQ